MSTKNNAANETTAMTARSGYGQLAEIDLAEMMSEELEGLDIGFERIKIPSGGAIMFELPGEDASEPETVKEFSGVILHHHTIYAYYKDKYTGGSNPPDCSSFDGKCGTGTPGGECQSCAFNQFGSGENGSKACKNKRRIYILREGEIFPMLLSLPTGSLKEFTRYIKRLLGKGQKSNQVVTKFSLKKAQNTKGVAYSQAQFAVDRVLTSEEHTHITKWTEQIKELSKHVALDYDTQDDVQSDVNVNPDTGELVEPLTANSNNLPDVPPPPSDSNYPY